MAQGFVLSFLVLNLACAIPLSAQNVVPVKATTTDAPVPGPVAYALRISAGDLLDIEVFDTPELSTKLRVDEHGMVTLPVGGVIPVSGMTADQIGQAIETRFREDDILKDPHVSVTVLEYATQGITVLGEVKNPGVYPLLGGHGLLDLISAAGGVTPNAGKAVTVTHRSDPEHPLIVSVDTKPGATPAFNIEMRPGDTVVVSRAGIVYVLGDVGKPGGFLIENSDRLTVLQAIALAQGTNRTASLNHAKLIRKTATGHEEVPIPLKKILADKLPDQKLADEDILYVPGSGPKNALRDVETILPSAAGAAIYRAP
jgi:polysaccharide biosynthesis/export protein